MDRKRFGDGKALAPIFGKKKPRQALLAHPNNSQPKTAAAAPYRGSSVTGMYGKNHQSNYSFTSSKGHTQPQFVQPNSTISYSKTVQQSSILPQSTTTQLSGSITGRSTGMPVTPKSLTLGPCEAAATSPIVGHQAWGCPSKPPLSKSHFTTSFYGSASQSNQNIAGTVLPRGQSKKPSKSLQRKEKSDTSLRVLTTTVATLQRWSQYTQKTTLMFEIFGVLNSAVLTAEKTTAKEFVIKDDTGIMKCIFYQIDRYLDRMTRGHWYRCVGTLDLNTRRLRCVSVRPTNAEEHRHSKLFVAVSDVAMAEFIKTSREM